MNENRKKNGYIGKMLSVILVIIISLGGAEIFLRIYDHYYPSFIFYKPDYNQFRGKPFLENFGFALNSQGFNNEEFKPKKTGTFRIVALGDSFAFGAVPHKNNYLTLLEEKLKHDGYNIEVLNMGIPKTGPQDYADLLKEEGLTLKPDLILVSFFIGNDFLIMKANDEPKTLRTKSYLLSLFYYIFSIRPYVNEGTNYGSNKIYDDSLPSFTTEKFLDIEHRQAALFKYPAASDKTSMVQNAFVKLKTPLEELVDLSHGSNAKIAFVVIPDAIQVDISLKQEVEKTYGENDNQYDFSFPDNILIGWFKNKKIPFLDLLETFKENAEKTGEKFYKPNDIHWNIAGNELAAEKIEKFLIQSSLLPAPGN